MERPNPVLAGFHPDPSIVRVGTDFFLATSSFEYFPGIPIHHSKDLVHWTLIGHALTRRSQIQIVGPEPGGGVWAPTLRYHGGTFYVATSNFSRFRPQEGERLYPRGFYVKTEDIWTSASWSDPVFFDVIGLDQDLFWDADDSTYLSTTHVKADRAADADSSRLDFAIHVCSVDLETGNSLTASTLIRESPSGIAEGSHIYRRGSYYYLTTAEGGTGSGHSVCVFRNQRGPLGPWEPCPDNPILASGVDHEVQNTGHADLVEDAGGRWWAALLGVRPRRTASGQWEESVLGRETFIVPVDWVDDWPVLNGGRSICLPRGQGSESDPKGVSKTLWRDDFAHPELRLGWYMKNTPEKTDHCIMKSPSRLRLYGGPYNLSIPAAPTMFLRKQACKSCVWRTRVSFTATTQHEEAGLVVWWNYLSYSSIGVRKQRREGIVTGSPGPREVRLRPAQGAAVTRELELPSSDVDLYVRCGAGYELGFRESGAASSEGGAQVHWLGRINNEVMTSAPSVGMAFSGMMVGLYAFSDYQKSLNPADFYYLECENWVDGA